MYNHWDKRIKDIVDKLGLYKGKEMSEEKENTGVMGFRKEYAILDFDPFLVTLGDMEELIRVLKLSAQDDDSVLYTYLAESLEAHRARLEGFYRGGGLDE